MANGERCGNANLVFDHRQSGNKSSATPHRPREFTDFKRGSGAYIAELQILPMPQRPALRRPEWLAHKGRRARQCGLKGLFHVRAREAGNSRQSPARFAKRPLRPRKRAL